MFNPSREQNINWCKPTHAELVSHNNLPVVDIILPPDKRFRSRTCKTNFHLWIPQTPKRIFLLGKLYFEDISQFSMWLCVASNIFLSDHWLWTVATLYRKGRFNHPFEHNFSKCLSRLFPCQSPILIHGCDCVVL